MRRIRFLPGSIALLCVLAGVWSAPARAQSAFIPKAGSAFTIGTGGTAVVAVTGPVRGCFIYNPPDSTEENIATAEKLFVDPVNAATTATNATNSAIIPGQSWTCPGSLAGGQSVSVNAATRAHRFTVVTW